MAEILAVISVLSGAASLVGLAWSWFDPKSEWGKRIAFFTFLIAFVFSGYMLFVPETSAVQNVKSKIQTYRVNNNNYLVQEGTFSFSENGPYDIQFPRPFVNPPKVVVVNFNGYEQQYTPYVKLTTKHFVRFKRDAIGGLTPHSMQTYKWIAEGVPMEPIN